MIKTTKQFSYLFFDLDGTLINSVKDITYALNKMRAHFNLTAITDTTTASIIGKGFPTTTQKVLALDLPEDKVKRYAKEALDLTLKYYELTMGEHTYIYPGVIETLDIFKSQNIPMAVVTNKEQAHAIKILSYLNLMPYFDCIAGGDTTAFYKPHPAPLAYACNKLHATIEQSLMIGDSLNDYLCAKVLGMSCILISHGYANGVNLHKLGALNVIEQFVELKQYAKQCSNSLNYNSK